jgi:hypothetical protein
VLNKLEAGKKYPARIKRGNKQIELPVAPAKS